MEGGEGVSFGLLSNEKFNRLVQAIIDLFRTNGVNVSLQINAAVLDIASGSVTHAYSKAAISLANTKPEITFAICMSTDYINENYSSPLIKLSQTDIQEKKAESKRTINVNPKNLHPLVEYVKTYCERLSGMNMLPSEPPLPEMGIPPSGPPPMSRRPQRRLPSNLPSFPDRNVSLPPIRNTGHANTAGNGPPDYSASKNQNLMDLLKRIEKIIDSMQSGRTDTITLQEIRGLFNALKRQLGVP
jgi:hypothetical protein